MQNETVLNEELTSWVEASSPLGNEYGHAFYQFKKIVATHATGIRESEWNRYRALSDKPEWPLSRVLAEGLFSSGMSVRTIFNEINRPFNEYAVDFPAIAQNIGEISGKPVYFFQEQGYYIWGKTLDSNPLELSLQFPGSQSIVAQV